VGLVPANPQSRMKATHAVSVFFVSTFLISSLISIGVQSQPVNSINPPLYPDPPVPGEVEFINPNPPPFTLPEIRGNAYKATVPATLDLAERARLAINGLTEIVNRGCEFEIFSSIAHMAQPPTMFHNPSDIPCQGKFLAVLPLMRVMSGSRQNLDIEQGMLEGLLKMQGEDGLIYTPNSGGREWILPSTFDPASGLPGINDGYKQVCLLGYGTARSVGALDTYSRLDPDGPWREAASKLVRGYEQVILEDGDNAHVFSTWMTPGKLIEMSENPFGEHLYLAGSQAWVALALAKHGAATGDSESTRLAEKMMNYNLLKIEYNEPSGRFKFGGPGVGAGKLKGKCAHFHTHAMNIIAALYVARETGNKVLLDRGLKSYEWAIQSSDTLVGFFPMVTYDEYAGAQTSETCEVADMIMCGVLLSQLGIDKWDDVDRWTRNQLAENQLTQSGWLTDGHLDYSRSPMKDGFFRPDRCSTDRVATRSVGNFAGWPTPNDWAYREDWWGGDTHDIITTTMTCCTGSGSRALYHVWRNMIEHDEGTLTVNLLLNRASKWVDIDSHIPYVGRVDFKIKKPLVLRVRLPEWVQPEQVSIELDGRPHPFETRGRHAEIGKVDSGQVVIMTFPITERTERRNIEGFDYTFIVRGNDVVSVDPPGRNLPLYQRGHYRGGHTLWRKVTRFVAEDELDW